MEIILQEMNTAMKIVRSKIKRCECVGNFDNEYVYDIGIHDNRRQWEFTNNILVHNSCYMCLDKPGFRKKYPNFDYSADNLVEFADNLGKQVNESFPQYMIDTFHCTKENSLIEEAAREVVASRGLVCGKKRYALMVFDKDGQRLDTHGKPGKIKIMGIQVSRSDCHRLVRDLLKKMLESVLTEGSKEKLLEILKEFAENEWGQLEPWEKGKPCACNKLTQYTENYKRTHKCSVAQVKGAIFWNIMVDANKDKKSPKILDGNKVVVCKLKKIIHMDLIQYLIHWISQFYQNGLKNYHLQNKIWQEVLLIKLLIQYLV